MTHFSGRTVWLTTDLSVFSIRPASLRLGVISTYRRLFAWLSMRQFPLKRLGLQLKSTLVPTTPEFAQLGSHAFGHALSEAPMQAKAKRDRAPLSEWNVVPMYIHSLKAIPLFEITQAALCFLPVGEVRIHDSGHT